MMILGGGWCGVVSSYEEGWQGETASRGMVVRRKESVTVRG